MRTQPTLLNSCGRAATSEEALFRVDYPNSQPRSTRVIALDRSAAELLRPISERPWNDARFSYISTDPSGEKQGYPTLLSGDGDELELGRELEDANTAVLVAMSEEGATAIPLIGEECARRRIMTSAVALGHPHEVREAVAALRPVAKVLVVTADSESLIDLLAAIRA